MHRRGIRGKVVGSLAALALAPVIAGCERSASLAERPAPRAPRPAQAPQAEPQSAAIAKMEQQVLQRINQVRRQHGLQPLQPHAALTRIARDYSRSMARQEFFSHYSPSGESVSDRAREAGIFYRLLGENLFKSWNVQQPVSTAVQGWMKSPGHRKNILREGFTHTGVGIWKDGRTYYYTQVFLRPL